MADEDDKEEEEKFTKRFNELFHKASAEREKRFSKTVEKLVEASVGGALTKFGEDLDGKLAALKPTPEPGKPTPEPGKPTPGVLSPEMEARIAKSEKDAKEARATAEKYQKEAELERARGRRSEEIQLLTQELTGKVKPTMLAMVVNQLHQGNIQRDEETGAILWKDGETVLPLKEGIATWAKSDLGKEFAPPVETGGKGGKGPGGAPSIQPGKMTEADIGGILFPGSGR